MQSEVSIQIQGGFGAAALWSRYRNLRTHRRVVRIAKRHDHRNAVGGAPLEDCDQYGPVLSCTCAGRGWSLGISRTEKKRWNRPETRGSNSGGLQEKAARQRHKLLPFLKFW